MGPPHWQGVGTRDEVLRWITSAGGVPSVLHFACHGRVDPDRPADAELLLANDTLTARDLVDAARLAAVVVDQVFLAACTTNTTGRDYDEAFSLASAFLAAGARTVFGSLWTVGDAETSLLMFMVHHYLMVDRHRPADALHAAQLWMLNPHRRAPRTMPAELAASSDQPELADPLAWAAFTHLGR
jgi:CHAT domain-containing protein